MKSPNDCLEEIICGDQGRYPYTVTATDFIPPDKLEDMLRVFVMAYVDDRYSDLAINGRSLAKEIRSAMEDRAQRLSQASVTPLDNDTNIADLKREM